MRSSERQEDTEPKTEGQFKSHEKVTEDGAEISSVGLPETPLSVSQENICTSKIDPTDDNDPLLESESTKVASSEQLATFPSSDNECEPETQQEYERKEMNELNLTIGSTITNPIVTTPMASVVITPSTPPVFSSEETVFSKTSSRFEMPEKDPECGTTSESVINTQDNKNAAHNESQLEKQIDTTDGNTIGAAAPVLDSPGNRKVSSEDTSTSSAITAFGLDKDCEDATPGDSEKFTNQEPHIQQDDFMSQEEQTETEISIGSGLLSAAVALSAAVVHQSPEEVASTASSRHSSTGSLAMSDQADEIVHRNKVDERYPNELMSGATSKEELEKYESESKEKEVKFEAQEESGSPHDSPISQDAAVDLHSKQVEHEMTVCETNESQQDNIWPIKEKETTQEILMKTAQSAVSSAVQMAEETVSVAESTMEQVSEEIAEKLESRELHMGSGDQLERVKELKTDDLAQSLSSGVQSSSILGDPIMAGDANKDNHNERMIASKSENSETGPVSFLIGGPLSATGENPSDVLSSLGDETDSSVERVQAESSNLQSEETRVKSEQKVTNDNEKTMVWEQSAKNTESIMGAQKMDSSSDEKVGSVIGEMTKTGTSLVETLPEFTQETAKTASTVMESMILDSAQLIEQQNVSIEAQENLSQLSSQTQAPSCVDSIQSEVCETVPERQIIEASSIVEEAVGTGSTDLNVETAHLCNTPSSSQVESDTTFSTGSSSVQVAGDITSETSAFDKLVAAGKDEIDICTGGQLEDSDKHKMEQDQNDRESHFSMPQLESSCERVLSAEYSASGPDSSHIVETASHSAMNLGDQAVLSTHGNVTGDSPLNADSDVITERRSPERELSGLPAVESTSSTGTGEKNTEATETSDLSAERTLNFNENESTPTEGQLKSPIAIEQDEENKQASVNEAESMQQAKMAQEEEQQQKDHKPIQIEHYTKTLKEAREVFGQLQEVAKQGIALKSAYRECKKNVIRSIEAQKEFESEEAYGPAKGDVPESEETDESDSGPDPLFQSLEKAAKIGAEYFSNVVASIESVKEPGEEKVGDEANQDKKSDAPDMKDEYKLNEPSSSSQSLPQDGKDADLSLSSMCSSALHSQSSQLSALEETLRAHMMTDEELDEIAQRRACSSSTSGIASESDDKTLNPAADDGKEEKVSTNETTQVKQETYTTGSSSGGGGTTTTTIYTTTVESSSTANANADQADGKSTGMRRFSSSEAEQNKAQELLEFKRRPSTMVPTSTHSDEFSSSNSMVFDSPSTQVGTINESQVEIQNSESELPGTTTTVHYETTEPGVVVKTTTTTRHFSGSSDEERQPMMSTVEFSEGNITTTLGAPGGFSYAPHSDLMEEETYSSGDFSDSQLSSAPPQIMETDDEVAFGNLEPGSTVTTVTTTTTTRTIRQDAENGNVMTGGILGETDNGHQTVITTVETSSTGGSGTSGLGASVGNNPDEEAILKEWGKPLGLPALYPEGTENGSNGPDSGNFATTESGRGTPKKGSSSAERKSHGTPKRVSRRSSRYNPIYVDLTYVPHHGNSHYCDSEFFRLIRSRYYVFSGLEPSREVFDGLLQGKQAWEDKNLGEWDFSIGLYVGYYQTV